jgi:hypothetical protein
LSNTPPAYTGSVFAGHREVPRKNPARVPVFTFFSVTIPVKAGWFEEEIYREVEEVEKVEEKEKTTTNFWFAFTDRTDFLVSNL